MAASGEPRVTDDEAEVRDRLSPAGIVGHVTSGNVHVSFWPQRACFLLPLVLSVTCWQCAVCGCPVPAVEDIDEVNHTHTVGCVVLYKDVVDDCSFVSTDDLIGPEISARLDLEALLKPFICSDASIIKSDEGLNIADVDVDVDVGEDCALVSSLDELRLTAGPMVAPFSDRHS